MSFLRRIKEGIDHTIWLALLFCLLAFLAYSRSPDPGREYGVSLATMIILYLGMGAVSGAILGLLMPYATNSARVALVGIPVAWPPAIGIVFLARDARLSELTSVDLIMSIVIAAVLGPIVATYMRLRGHIGPPQAARQDDSARVADKGDIR